MALLSALACAALAPSTTSAFFVLGQARIVGWGDIGKAYQGWGMALSGDGNTLATGGIEDNGSKGATWVFARDNVTRNWTQQGEKLVGVGHLGAALQGSSVALSDDGNTLASGARWENTNVGGVFLFVRSANSWTQQGSVLVGTGSTGNANQGAAVALSADGNTLAFGGVGDNSSVGAVWVFTRSGTVWSQQGGKLVGSGNIGVSNQGGAVALSADGNTLAWGGMVDNSYQGAVWVYSRNQSGVWTSQTSKLVGTGNVGQARQGYTVALSTDGNTLASAGYQDNGGRGAVWIFVRNGTVWSQQGDKVLREYWQAYDPSYFGASVALGGPNGDLLAVGAIQDLSNRGDVFIFQRTGTTWQARGLGVVGIYGESGTPFIGGMVDLSRSGRTLAFSGTGYNASQGASWIYEEEVTGSPTTLAPSSSFAGNATVEPTVDGSSPATNSTRTPSVPFAGGKLVSPGTLLLFQYAFVLVQMVL